MAIGKGSLQRAASAAAHAEQKRTVSKQEMWLAKVRTEQLQEVPAEWRGSAYVRPNVSLLAESISKCGILEPLPAVQIAENAYQLVGGSRRMEVIKMLGIEEVPLVVLPGETPEDAKRLYLEMRPYTDAAQDTIYNAKFRTAALFGTRRVPEYLL